MSELVIKVENISKAYRIGLKERRYDTLGAAIAAWVKSPFKNFKQLKSLSNFNNKDDADIFWALKDINFEVRKGEVLGIIGKNGAGKSTLLKILSRITEPAAGRIEIYGRVASLLEVGTGFNPELSGTENVYLNGTILGMTKKEIDGKFDEIIDFSGIEKFIDTPVKRYSSGMKVRLAFSIAAYLEPEILIIDEVLAVGDAEFQKKCLGKMHDVSSAGRTVLFVSHNMAAVQSLCSRCLLLNGGKIVFNGEVNKCISNYSLSILEKTEDVTSFFQIYNFKINNNSNFEFFYDEPLEIQFNIKAKENISETKFIFLIQDDEGVCLIHLKDENFIIKAGDGTYTIRIDPLYIRSGSYSCFFKIITSKINLPRFVSDYYPLICNSRTKVNTVGIIQPNYTITQI